MRFRNLQQNFVIDEIDGFHIMKGGILKSFLSMYAAFPESLRGAQAGHRCFAAHVPINCMGS